MEPFGIVSVSFWLLFSISIWAALQWYYNRKYGLWEQQGIPNERPQSMFEKYLTFRQLPVSSEKEKYEKFGRCYGCFENDTPILFVAEPEIIKTIYVKDFDVFNSGEDFTGGNPVTDLMLTVQKGESWKRIRSIISPSFTSGKLKMMAPLVEEVIQTFLQHILEEGKAGNNVNFDKRFSHLTMATVARCSFGTRVKNMMDENDTFIQSARRIFSPATTLKFKFRSLFPWLAKFLKLDILPSDSVNYFRDLSKTIIQQRRERKIRENDFLQLILDALDGKTDTITDDPTDLSHYDVGGSDSKHWNPHSKKKFVSEDEALAQCIMFLFAGVHTSATALAYISYDLATNPDYQEKLIEEVDGYWKEMNGKIDLPTVNRMSYLDAFVSESLRRHTLGLRLLREAQEDYVLSEKRIKIPKGAVVSVPISAIHYDPEWYPEPLKFDPERFSPENRKARNPYTFLPFGVGPRNCVAMRFALMVVKLCTFRMLRRVRFIRTDKTMVPLKINFIGGLLVPESVTLGIEKRHITD